MSQKTKKPARPRIVVQSLEERPASRSSWPRPST
jgi:hypothetical protein